MGNSIPDPGPPTWKEALDGAQLERAKAGDMVRRTKDALARLGSGDDPVRLSTTGMLIKAESEWKHWNGYAAKAAAFIRVHPAMADSSIYAKCGHDGPFGGCALLAYPGAAAVANDYHEKELGDDDGDE